jgi:hypothetical protein
VSVTRIALLGLGLFALGCVAVPWLVFREIQWHRRQRWMGHYEQPVEPWRPDEDDEVNGLAMWAEADAHAR